MTCKTHTIATSVDEEGCCSSCGEDLNPIMDIDCTQCPYRSCMNGCRSQYAKNKQLEAENVKLKGDRTRLRLDLRNIVSCHKDHAATMNANWTKIATKMRDIADKAYWVNKRAD